jgi:hypothetical protein
MAEHQDMESKRGYFRIEKNFVKHLSDLTGKAGLIYE